MTGRIYIRDFSCEATAEDLTRLISKVCPVEEVYISGKTPTGINRSFAIVVVNANDTMIEKCIKTFNNCHWKGTKIWVEKAKEYYKDRFERERARERKLAGNKLQLHENVEDDKEIDKFEDELLREIESADIDKMEEELLRETESALIIESASEENKVPNSTPKKSAVAIMKHVIRIKKTRDGLPIAISMLPALSSSTAVKKSKKFLSCGRRTTFDYDDSGSIVYTPMETEDAGTSGDDSSDGSDDEEVVKTEAEIKAEKLEQSLRDKKSKEVSKHNSDARAIATGTGSAPVAEVSKAQGGGARKGFGGLSTVAVSALPVPLSQAYLKKLVPQAPTPKVDCCNDDTDYGKAMAPIFGIDADDLRNDAAKEMIEFAGDDDNRNPYRVDDVACIDSKELTDEALQAERQRSLNMFALIMQSSGSSSIDAPSGTVVISKKKPVAKEEKEKIIAKEEKESAANSNKSVVKAWELMKPQRFDPTNKKTAAKFELTSEEASERNKAAMASAAAEKKLLLEKEEKDKAAMIAEEASKASAGVGGKEDDNFANLDSLKNIFYQEGGVWWGDDGTLNEAVSKGDIAGDALFREAEKLGIDIRKKRPDEAPKSAQEESQALSSALGAKVVDASKMTFGFFDDYFATDETATAAAASAAAARNVTQVEVEEKAEKVEKKDKKVTLTEEKEKSILKEAATKKEGQGSASIPRAGAVEETQAEAEVLDEAEPEVVFMSMQSIAANAKRFCRERNESELFADWRESRDKLVVDYKRKSKDAKKRVLETQSKTSFQTQAPKDSQVRPHTQDGASDKGSEFSSKRGRSDKGSDHGARGGKKGRGTRGVIRKILVK